MTVFLSVKDRAVGNLAGELTSGALSLTLQSGQGASFPDPDSGDEDFIFTIEDEHLLCTARTGDGLTVTRAQEGTADVTHAGGVAVELRVVASQFSAIHAAVNTLEGQVGNVDSHLVEPFSGLAVAVIDGSALLTTVGILGRFRLSHRLTFKKWSYIVGVAGSANCVISLGIFSGDGATQFVDEDHAVGSSTGPQTVTMGAAISLPPGDYYVLVTMSSGTTGSQLKHWDTGVQDLINTNVPASEPVYEGTVTVTGGAVPATIDPTAISGAQDSTPFIRLDTA